MIVSVVCIVGMKRSQESVSLQRQVELLLVRVSQLEKERRAAVTRGEKMAKHERQRAEAAETRACNEKTRADAEKIRADSAEVRVKEVETEKMGIEWTNLSFRCYHQHSDNYKQVSDTRSFDLYIPHMYVHV